MFAVLTLLPKLLTWLLPQKMLAQGRKAEKDHLLSGLLLNIGVELKLSEMTLCLLSTLLSLFNIQSHLPAWISTNLTYKATYQMIIGYS